jgi:hypothetical protein
MPRVRGFTAAAAALTGLRWLLTACTSSQAVAHKVAPAAVASASKQVNSFCPGAAS